MQPISRHKLDDQIAGIYPSTSHGSRNVSSVLFLTSNLGKMDVKMGMRWLRRSQNLEGLVEEEDELPWSPTVSSPRAVDSWEHG